MAVSESLQLAGSNHSVELDLTSKVTTLSFDLAPELVDSVRYTYAAKAGVAIKRVDFNLTDSTREVRIDGAVPEQVEGLLGVVSADMEAARTGFGGFRFRNYAGSAAFASVMTTMITLSALPLLGFRSPRAATLAAVNAGCFLIIVMLFVFPWPRWFPGTAVYSDSASWMVRNSALVGVVGAALTVVTFALSLAVSFYLSRPRR